MLQNDSNSYAQAGLRPKRTGVEKLSHWKSGVICRQYVPIESLIMSNYETAKLSIVSQT